MLTAEQQKLRVGKLTASRVSCLMTGDAEKILRLWREMIGEEQPENLDHVLQVRMGEVTEPLNLEWYESKHGHSITKQGNFINHPKYDWAGCTLDGWITELDCPIECKHVSGREPIDPVVISRYQPQMQYQMECSGAKQCALSIFISNYDHVVKFVERDPVYAAEMMRRGEQFMQSVWKCIPPVILPPAPEPVEAKRDYDMTGNNMWAHGATQWMETKDAKSRNVDAEKILKSLVPDDAKKCFGHGVRITRDSAGRLSLREDKIR